MATFSRSAALHWDDDTLAGAGRIVAGSGAFDAAATFPSIRGEAPATTTPEEMLAASHAICFGIGFRSLVTRRGGRADRLSVTATITADKSAHGIRITSSHLDVTVFGLSGIERDQLHVIGAETESGCTISNALRGNVQITFAIGIEG